MARVFVDINVLFPFSPAGEGAGSLWWTCSPGKWGSRTQGEG